MKPELEDHSMKGENIQVSRPEKGLRGTITVPGDKSISHRAVILGSIAAGMSRVQGFLPSQDCLATIGCMRRLGVTITRVDETDLEIGGVGLRGLRQPEGVLDAGNSGTTIRLLSGVLAGQPFAVSLTGDDSLQRRPMMRIVEPLRMMGAVITGREGGRFAPLHITGGALKPIVYTLPVASAQVKSAILLAGLYADGMTEVQEPAPSRDHTERMISLQGRSVSSRDGIITIKGGGELAPFRISVPGDISSAAFLLVAGLICPDSDLKLEHVGVNATRTGILDVLRQMGGRVAFSNPCTEGREPVADIWVKSTRLRATEIGGEIIPRIIDELPVIAVAASQAEGQTVVRDAGELRVKETDRIGAIVGELLKMGAHIEERPDGFVVEGPTVLRGAACDSHGDHRIAMALAVAGLVAEGETIIENAGCVDVSFPGFFETLGSLSE